jgi:hypothetical protein
MKYKVYQINFTDEQVKRINDRANYDAPPRYYYLYLDTITQPTAEAILRAAVMYRTAATIEAPDLDGVFHIGNVGPVHLIQRSVNPFHSVSVGDVIVDENNKAFFVDSFGYKEVPDLVELWEASETI